MEDSEEDFEDSVDDFEEEELLLELSKKLKAQPIISVAGYIPDPDLKDDSARYRGRMSVLLPLPDLSPCLIMKGWEGWKYMMTAPR